MVQFKPGLINCGLGIGLDKKIAHSKVVVFFGELGNPHDKEKGDTVQIVPQVSTTHSHQIRVAVVADVIF